MTIRVKLFAAARERAGHDTLVLELPPGATLQHLRENITKTRPELATIISHSAWAIDTAYATNETPITEHSEIALIPPVSGG